MARSKSVEKGKSIREALGLGHVVPSSDLSVLAGVRTEKLFIKWGTS